MTSFQSLRNSKSSKNNSSNSSKNKSKNGKLANPYNRMELWSICTVKSKKTLNLLSVSYGKRACIIHYSQILIRIMTKFKISNPTPNYWEGNQYKMSNNKNKR